MRRFQFELLSDEEDLEAEVKGSTRIGCVSVILKIIFGYVYVFFLFSVEFVFSFPSLSIWFIARSSRSDNYNFYWK